MGQQFAATSPSELPTLADLAGRSGIEFMRAMQAGELSGPPISRAMNYHLHSVEEGRVAFRGAPEFQFVNPMGGVHGGWYGTLLDSCMACAVMTTLPKGRIYTTLEYKINIIRAVPLGVEVEALGVISHAGRSTGVAEGTIRGVADGKLYATGSTTCLIMEAPKL